MTNKVWLLVLPILAVFSGCEKSEPGSGEEKSLVLVSEGQAVSALVLPEDAPSWLRGAAEDFVATVARSTGAMIPLVEEDQEAALAPEIMRMYVGPCEKTQAAGFSVSDLEAETWRIVAQDGVLFVFGNDRGDSAKGISRQSFPTRWALNHLLETGLGVRWLWPGELGTYVPPSDTLAFGEMDRRYQPRLIWRQLAGVGGAASAALDPDGTQDAETVKKERQAEEEALIWLANHQAGRRGNISFGHAFGDWWEKYSRDHPDYFAETPPGVEQPYPAAGRAKLRLANPAVIEQIAQEYQAAGAPEYWNVCPNDGGGFDLSPETCAWDIPANQDPQKIWRATADLTARYVQFWNLVSQRLEQINPEVKLATYVYSAYRNPPPPERPLTAKAVVGIVDKYNAGAYELWKAWANNSAGMFLRPNWWHVGAEAPHLPLKDVSDFLHFAWDNGLMGLHMDSLMGYWATQGPNYYLVARLMTRPDLTYEDIVAEYCSAFGAAAPKIRGYLAYWENETRLNGYPAPVGGHSSTNPEGRYEKLVRDGKFQMNPIGGSHQALPYLYSDETLQPALGLLDEAEAMVSADPEARERVRFLRRGLEALRATRDVVALSQEFRRQPSPERLAEFQKSSDALESLRGTLTSDHVVWGGHLTQYEDRRRFPIRPRNLNLPELNTDGL